MIVNFIGEFLFHPTMLEMSGNTCTHNCCYCFANIRKQSRYSKINSAFNQLKKTNIKTFVDYLIQNDYPICLSNSTDPFSQTDYINTINLAQYLKEKQNGIFWQTKGGKGVDEVLEILSEKRNQVWYITITTLDAELSKRIEANAPTPNERIELVKKLISKGYLVVIAINPLSELWLPKKEFEIFIKTFSDLGVKHFVIEQLHLNKKEIKNFTPNRRSKFTDIEIETVLEHKKELQYARDCVDYVDSIGLMPMKIGMPKKSLFFNEIRSKLGKSSPNHFDLINYCFENNTPKGLDITYSMFEKLMTNGNEELFNSKFNGFKSYVFKASAHEWIENENTKKIETLKDVMKIFWNSKRIKQSPQHNALFQIKENELDKEGNIILYFDGVVRRNKSEKILKMLETEMTYK